MKRVILSAVLMIVICTASFAKKIIAEGKTFSALGDYKIEAMDEPVVLNGQEMEAFIISYQNTGMKVTVAVEKTKICKNYYVLSDNLSIKYVCNKNYFGVERLNKDLEKEGYKTLSDQLNNVEYFRQKLITTGGNSDLTNSRLIAAYFPFLLKDQKSVLAVK
ncbi:MAG TPA: hypothetical protein VMW32_09810 [Bacteroidales bacterium]|nr:hypothetical protein [Bacteroidales bacterium]